MRKSILSSLRQPEFLAILLLAVVSNGLWAHAFSLSMVDRGTVVVAGATGYIGKSTVRESVRQGYKTYALVRDVRKVQSEQGQKLYGEFFKNAEIIECDVSDPKQLEKVGTGRKETTATDPRLSLVPTGKLKQLQLFVYVADDDAHQIHHGINRIGSVVSSIAFGNQKRGLSN